MTTNRFSGFLVAVLSLSLLGTWGFGQEAPQTPPPPAQSRAGEIHRACEKEGLKVVSVRQDAKGRYTVDCADPSDHDKALAITQRVLGTEPPGQTPVTTLQDALVVIRFEPTNIRANQLLLKRYEELRANHLKVLEKSKRR